MSTKKLSMLKLMAFLLCVCVVPISIATEERGVVVSQTAWEAYPKKIGEKTYYSLTIRTRFKWETIAVTLKVKPPKEQSITLDSIQIESKFNYHIKNTTLANCPIFEKLSSSSSCYLYPLDIDIPVIVTGEGLFEIEGEVWIDVSPEDASRRASVTQASESFNFNVFAFKGRYAIGHTLLNPAAQIAHELLIEQNTKEHEVLVKLKNEWATHIKGSHYSNRTFSREEARARSLIFKRAKQLIQEYHDKYPDL